MRGIITLIVAAFGLLAIKEALSATAQAAPSPSNANVIAPSPAVAFPNGSQPLVNDLRICGTRYKPAYPLQGCNTDPATGKQSCWTYAIRLAARPPGSANSDYCAQ